jgi:hypothetical protein
MFHVLPGHLQTLLCHFHALHDCPQIHLFHHHVGVHLDYSAYHALVLLYFRGYRDPVLFKFGEAAQQTGKLIIAYL